jgi:hypothetical protein
VQSGSSSLPPAEVEAEDEAEEEDEVTEEEEEEEEPALFLCHTSLSFYQITSAFYPNKYLLCFPLGSLKMYLLKCVYWAFENISPMGPQMGS